MAAPTTPGTEIETIVASATTLVSSSTSLSLNDLLKALSPTQVSAPSPAVVPAPRKITDAQRDSIAKMPEVYGKVVPTERRALEPAEIIALITERVTLDDVKKTAEARLKDITLIAHNHLDVQIDALPEDQRSSILRDDDGHYIKAGTISVDDLGQQFSREEREGSSTLTTSDLEGLEAARVIDHETFLALTTPIRVVDEAKFMVFVRKNPDLLAKIAPAITPGKRGTSMYVRAKK